MDSTTVQIIFGFLMSYVIEWLKKASWFPMISENSTKAMKWLFSGIVAAGSAMAINVGWEPMTGVLTLSGLTWDNIWNGLVAFALSYITQHTVYKTIIEKEKA